MGCCPKTCADYPVGTCGSQGDGCGGIVGPCTTCAAPEFCGGGGPDLCGTGVGAGRRERLKLGLGLWRRQQLGVRRRLPGVLSYQDVRGLPNRRLRHPERRLRRSHC